MRRYYYDNWLAKVLLCFSTCHTIAIGWFVLSKRDEKGTLQRSRNHETIHAVQWTEVTLLTVCVLCVMDFLFGISAFAYLLSGMGYYAWYLVEWLCKMPGGNAYRSISFEQEAYDNDNDNDYVENRCMFTGWAKRVFCVVRK